MSRSFSSEVQGRFSGISESSKPPLLSIIPDTPPIQAQSQFSALKIRDLVADEDASEHLHVPPHNTYNRVHADPPPSNVQATILGALSVGAPLIASVVSSCTSGICADLTAILGADPLTRPARASAIIALLWCALITSLGATMTAVAGLAMSSGYHDHHVGVTKRIVRFVRQWHASRNPRHSGGNMPLAEISNAHAEMRAPSPALSAITDTNKDQHAIASFRAAVVSARLLGLSVALLAIALALYLFLLYPISVAACTTGVGILTTALVAVPLLAIIWPG